MTTDLHTPLKPQLRLRHARLAASTLFAIVGAATGTWTARMPTIEQHLNLSHGQLSIALLALALGGLAGMSLTGRLVDRYGTQQVLVPAALALGPALAALVYTPTFLTLVAALLLFGFVHGTTNVSMNAYAVACETAYGRPIMSSIHAWFSVGGLLAAAGGAAFSAADPTASGTFTTAGALSLVLAGGSLLAARHAHIDGVLPPSSRSSAAIGRRPASIPFWRMAGLGLIAFCSLLCEGATADWSSVYLHDSLHGSLGISASAYAVFALTMTGGRLTADRLVARYGPSTVLRACGLLAAGGFAAGAVTGAPLAAVAGFGLLGAGLSCVVPQVYSAAGHLDAAHAGGVLSRVAALGYSGFVIGPVLIGALAEQVGLAAAMLLLPVLTLVVAVSGGLVRTRESWRRHSATAIRT
jgi:MFS family permease